MVLPKPKSFLNRQRSKNEAKNVVKKQKSKPAPKYFVSKPVPRSTYSKSRIFGIGKRNDKKKTKQEGIVATPKKNVADKMMELNNPAKNKGPEIADPLPNMPLPSPRSQLKLDLDLLPRRKSKEPAKIAVVEAKPRVSFKLPQSAEQRMEKIETAEAATETEAIEPIEPSASVVSTPRSMTDVSTSTIDDAIELVNEESEAPEAVKGPADEVPSAAQSLDSLQPVMAILSDTDEKADVKVEQTQAQEAPVVAEVSIEPEKKTEEPAAVAESKPHVTFLIPDDHATEAAVFEQETPEVSAPTTTAIDEIVAISETVPRVAQTDDQTAVQPEPDVAVPVDLQIAETAVPDAADTVVDTEQPPVEPEQAAPIALVPVGIVQLQNEDTVVPDAAPVQTDDPAARVPEEVPVDSTELLIQEDTTDQPVITATEPIEQTVQNDQPIVQTEVPIATEPETVQNTIVIIETEQPVTAEPEPIQPTVENDQPIVQLEEPIIPQPETVNTIVIIETEQPVNDNQVPTEPIQETTVVIEPPPQPLETTEPAPDEEEDQPGPSMQYLAVMPLPTIEPYDFDTMNSIVEIPPEKPLPEVITTQPTVLVVPAEKTVQFAPVQQTIIPFTICGCNVMTAVTLVAIVQIVIATILLTTSAVGLHRLQHNEPNHKLISYDSVLVMHSFGESYTSAWTTAFVELTLAHKLAFCTVWMVSIGILLFAIRCYWAVMVLPNMVVLMVGSVMTLLALGAFFVHVVTEKGEKWHYEERILVYALAYLAVFLLLFLVFLFVICKFFVHVNRSIVVTE